MIHTDSHNQWYWRTSVTHTKRIAEKWWIGRTDWKWEQVAGRGRRSEDENHEKDVTRSIGEDEREKYEKRMETGWNQETKSKYLGRSAWVKGEIYSKCKFFILLCIFWCIFWNSQVSLFIAMSYLSMYFFLILCHLFFYFLIEKDENISQ